MQLRTIELTEYEAEQVAYKLDVMGSTYAEISNDEIKRVQAEAKAERDAIKAGRHGRS